MSSSRTLHDSLLEAIDNAWDPATARLTGLGEAEYCWQPVAGCWGVRAEGDTWVADWADPDPDPAPVTTIAWRTWHIAVDALDSYSERLFDTRGTGLTGTQWVGTWAEAEPLMAAAFAVYRDGVANWSEASLLEPLGPTWGPFADHTHLDLALHANREVIHHLAEIALLRDLYRARHDQRLDDLRP
jgi:hypothetical protein